jgi:hypothetical protein
MVIRRVLATPVLLAALAACSGGATPQAQSPTTTARHAVVAAPAPTMTSTSARDATPDRYNPTHDPTKCVRLLPNGQVVFVENPARTRFTETRVRERREVRLI